MSMLVELYESHGVSSNSYPHCLYESRISVTATAPPLLENPNNFFNPRVWIPVLLLSVTCVIFLLSICLRKLCGKPRPIKQPTEDNHPMKISHPHLVENGAEVDVYDRKIFVSRRKTSSLSFSLSLEDLGDDQLMGKMYVNCLASQRQKSYPETRSDAPERNNDIRAIDGHFAASSSRSGSGGRIASPNVPKYINTANNCDLRDPPRDVISDGSCGTCSIEHNTVTTPCRAGEDAPQTTLSPRISDASSCTSSKYYTIEPSQSMNSLCDYYDILWRPDVEDCI